MTDRPKHQDSYRQTLSFFVQPYRKIMYRYGLLTLLFLLDYYEEDEDYHQCHEIYTCIRREEAYLGTELGTRYTDEVLKNVKASYKKAGMTGIHAVENSMLYATLLRDQFRKHKTYKLESINT